MKWKPIAWLCMAFIVFVVVAGPAFVATVQQNRQQAFTMKKQVEQIVDLQSELQDSTSRFEADVKTKVRSACAPIEAQLTDAQTRLRGLTAELAALAGRRSYERDMQSNLHSVSARIAAMEREAVNSHGDREVALRKDIAALRTRHDQTEARLDALHMSGADEWDEMRSHMDDAWDQLSALLDDDQDKTTTVANAPNVMEQPN